MEKEGFGESGESSSKAGNPFASAENGSTPVQRIGQNADAFAAFQPYEGKQLSEDFYATQHANETGQSTTKKAMDEPAWASGKFKEDNKKVESEIIDITQREKLLAEREAALDRREKQMQQESRYLIPDKNRKNYPSCYPILHIDIRNDIPDDMKAQVRLSFICWHMTEAAYALNFFCMFLILVTGSGVNFSTFLINCMATGAGMPLAWICWFKSHYAAAQTNAAIFAYLKFFFHFGFHIGFCALAFLSPPLIGTFNAGMFTMVEQFEKGGSKHGFFGFLCLVNTLLWLAVGLLSLYIMHQAFKTFRAGGGIEATQQAGNAALVAARTSAAFVSNDKSNLPR